MVIMKRLTATLAAGTTSLTFTDAAINSNSVIEIYTSDMDAYPITQAQTAANSVTITFNAQTDPVSVLCLVNNVISQSDPAISNLSDVQLTELTNDQILIFNGSKWINADNTAGASSLEELSDVVLTTPTIGQILTYDGDEWVNGDAPSGGEIIYSTTERTIGKWIDDKPLYEITYEYTNTGLSSTTDIITLSSEIVVRDIRGVLCNTDGRVYILPYSKGSSTTSIIVTADNKIEIVLNSDSWGSSYTPWYITIQYTKNTD